MSKKTVAKKGVTLMELLVVLALLSIVSLSLFTIFRTATESYSKGDARTQAYQNARAALEMMAREIQTAFLSSDTNLVFRGESDHLHFVGIIPSDSDDESDVCHIGYWLNGATLERRMERQNTDGSIPQWDWTSGPSGGLPLAEWINNVNFYYDDGTVDWESGTNEVQSITNILPYAVKISIEATDEKGKTNNVFPFSIVICLPNAE